MSSTIPPLAWTHPAVFRKYAAHRLATTPQRDTYKRAFWRLAMQLGRLPTTRDTAYWDLPVAERGVS